MESPVYLCGFCLVIVQGRELAAEGSVSQAPLGILGHLPGLCPTSRLGEHLEKKQFSG